MTVLPFPAPSKDEMEQGPHHSAALGASLPTDALVQLIIMRAKLERDLAKKYIEFWSCIHSCTDVPSESASRGKRATGTSDATLGKTVLQPVPLKDLQIRYKQVRNAFDDSLIYTASQMLADKKKEHLETLERIRSAVIDLESSLRTADTAILEESPSTSIGAMMKLQYIAGVFVATEDGDSQYMGAIIQECVLALNGGTTIELCQSNPTQCTPL